MMTVAYVAHPVGQEPARAANLIRLRRWMAWLIPQHPNFALVAPWALYCDVLDETPENRARGIRDDLWVLYRCDAIILVGGVMSPGMAKEHDIALCEGKRTINYLHLGAEPPATEGGEPWTPR